MYNKNKFFKCEFGFGISFILEIMPEILCYGSKCKCFQTSQMLNFDIYLLRTLPSYFNSLKYRNSRIG